MDRVGIGWRRELAAGILGNLDRIDVVEVLAADYPRRELNALRSLAATVPVHVHGTDLGLASSEPADERRLSRMARVVAAIEPEAWSEHLAFVRGGGVEIGHLAAPPRSAASIDGAARNLARARAVVGCDPLVENVATLIDPPGSDMDEPAFIAAALEATGCALLLDLHNLYANATSFNWDPRAMLDAIPPARIGAVHIGGGRRLGARVLDDHLHAVPDPVYSLLAEVAARAPGPLTVILERDGRYPPMPDLLAELDRARAALRLGRARRAA